MTTGTKDLYFTKKVGHGEIKYNEHVNTITCIDRAKIAIAHIYNGSYVDIINTGVNLNDKTLPFKLTVSGMYFHQQQFYLDVIGDDIHVADINGKITGTIPTEPSENVYYTDQVNHKVVCCDMKGNKIWEHVDKRIIKNACLTLDNGGNVFVVGYEANVIIMILIDGKQSKVILDATNKIKRPTGIHCDRDRKLLLVCSEADDYAGLFDIIN